MFMNYHEDTTHLTKTQLATFLKSPVDYYHTFITRKMPSRASFALSSALPPLDA